MLFRTASALAVLAMASQSIAEQMLYKMAARDIFGLERRDDAAYQPSTKFCKNGSSCAEACGAGYLTCPSTDNAIHCFNPSNKQICCSDAAGNICDTGFYCASHAAKGSLCCPVGKSAEDCAKSYGLTGAVESKAQATLTSKPTGSKSGSSTHVMTYAPGATYPVSNTTVKTVPTPTTPSTVSKDAATAARSGAALLLVGAAIAALL